MDALSTEDRLRLAHALAYAATAAAAAGVALRTPRHRVVAVVFGVFVIAVVTRLALAPALDGLDDPRRAAPWSYYLDHAAGLACPLGLAGAVWVHVARRSRAEIALASAAVLLALVAYKESTGASLVPFHAVVWAACTVVSSAVLARAALAPAERSRAPDAPTAVLALLVGADVVRVVFGADGLDVVWLDLLWVDLAITAAVLTGYVAALVAASARRLQRSARSGEVR